MQSYQQDFDSEDLEILKVLETFPKQKIQTVKNYQQQRSIKNTQSQIDNQLWLSDAVLIMLAKEIQYVDTLTGFKSGFLFNDRKINIFTDSVTSDLIPTEYKELWNVIESGNTRKSHNLRKFFNKMLSSKNIMFARECFLVYFQCIQHILYLQSQNRGLLLDQATMNKNAENFSQYFMKTVFEQDSQGNLISVNPNYQNITLTNRGIPIKELFQFQANLNLNYARFKQQFMHFLTITYYCIQMQFYGIQATSLYEGYFKNTELQTVRGVPKLKSD